MLWPHIAHGCKVNTIKYVIISVPYIYFVYVLEPSERGNSNSIYLRANTTKGAVMTNHNLFDRSHYGPLLFK